MRPEAPTPDGKHRPTGRRAGRRVVLGVALVALAAGPACDEWNIDSCQPTALELRAPDVGSLEVELRSGDQGLRKRPVTVEALEAGEIVEAVEVTTGTGGEAEVRFGAGVLERATEVRAHHVGGEAYCHATAAITLPRP